MLMQHVGVGYFGYYRATIYVGFQAGNLDFSATSNGVGCHINDRLSDTYRNNDFDTEFVT